jgi:tetratricopeptide (TPR) repeat protein
MTPRSRAAVAAAVVAVIGLGGISAALQVIRDRRPLPSGNEETLFLTERAAGRSIFTFRTLAADLYWIRAIQYFGGHSRTARTFQGDALAPPASISTDPTESFDQLYQLLDITTTLDPRFNIAYRFGSIFLSAHYPEGPGRPDLAIKLLEKGLKAAPEKWQYWHDIGFVHYWNDHDYRKASEAFRRGADLPGAPWWLKSLAATMLAKGGDRETSRLLWRQLYETADNDYAREAARTKLMQLKAIEDIERLQKAIDLFAARRGSAVSGWTDLLAAGAVRDVPRDPAGAPYRLTSDGRVQVSDSSPLFPLPIEPETRSGA